MIRRAVEKDIPELERLLFQVQQVHATGRPDIFRPGKKKYSSEELQALISVETTPIYVYEDAQEGILGYAFCVLKGVKDHPSLSDRKELYIDDLCVDEKVRRKGIGKKLYHFVEEMAKEQGFDVITLHAWNVNPSAIRFYEELGMSEYYKAMEKKLK